MLVWGCKLNWPYLLASAATRVLPVLLPSDRRSELGGAHPIQGNALHSKSTRWRLVHQSWIQLFCHFDVSHITWEGYGGSMRIRNYIWWHSFFHFCFKIIYKIDNDNDLKWKRSKNRNSPDRLSNFRIATSTQWNEQSSAQKLTHPVICSIYQQNLIHIQYV